MTMMMSQYEIKKLAKEIVTLVKEDDELIDLIYPPLLMDMEEAAGYMRIPVGTLYQKVNEIPHMKVGKRLVFSDRSLIRWMQRRKKK